MSLKNREISKEELKRLEGGNAEPIDKTSEVDLFCQKSGHHQIDRCTFERIVEAEEGDKKMGYYRTVGNPHPLKFTILDKADKSLSSLLGDKNLMHARIGGRIMIWGLLGILLPLLFFEEYRIQTRLMITEAFAENSWFAFLFGGLIFALIVATGLLIYFSKYSTYHDLMLYCNGQHEGDIHNCVVLTSDNSHEAFEMLYGKMDEQTQKLLVSIRENFSDKIDSIKEEMRDIKLDKREEQKKNYKRTARQEVAMRRFSEDEYQVNPWKTFGISLVSFFSGVGVIVLIFQVF